MTAVPMQSGPVQARPDRERVLAQVTGMLAAVTGEDEQWAGRVTAASALERDLRLESVELAALSELLRRAYGERADLAAFLAELEIYEIIALTVGDLVTYVCASAAAPPAASPAGMPR